MLLLHQSPTFLYIIKMLKKKITDKVPYLPKNCFVSIDDLGTKWAIFHDTEAREQNNKWPINLRWCIGFTQITRDSQIHFKLMNHGKTDLICRILLLGRNNLNHTKLTEIWWNTQNNFTKLSGKYILWSWNQDVLSVASTSDPNSKRKTKL